MYTYVRMCVSEWVGVGVGGCRWVSRRGWVLHMYASVNASTYVHAYVYHPFMFL